MASVISDLEVLVQDALEESRGLPGTFWDVAAELRPFLVEAFSEAAIITNEPQLRQSTTVTLLPGVTLQPLPAAAMALLRLEGTLGLPVRKTTLWDMDRFVPGWEADTGDNPDFWFPVGLTQFGIHPQLTAPAQVVLTFMASPISSGRPYSGLENIPFQDEYRDGFVAYASHVARLKEGSDEFTQALPLYERYLAAMTELSRFAYRKGSLRFSRSAGSAAAIAPVEIR